MKNIYFLLSLREGEILQILQSDWFRERFFFSISPANPGWIVSSFIHKFVCCLWLSKNRDFETIFLLKLALLLALAREKWILLFRQEIWRENQASQLGKPLKWSKTGGSWCRFTSFITYAGSTAILLFGPFIRHFCSVCSFVFHFCCLNLDAAVFHWILPR